LDITKTSKSNYIISIVNEGIRIETLAHRNLKLEVGSRMLKVGSWKLEVGSLCAAGGSWISEKTKSEICISYM
jgi:hypothetical protein